MSANNPPPPATPNDPVVVLTTYAEALRKHRNQLEVLVAQQAAEIQLLRQELAAKRTPAAKEVAP